MSERDPREELRDIVGGLRGWIERERSSGDLEPLMTAVGAAYRAPRTTAPEPDGAPAPRPASAAGSRGAGALPSAAVVSTPPAPPYGAAPSVAMAALGESWEPIVAGSKPAAPPLQAQAQPATAVAEAEAPPSVNLFGEKTQPKVAAGPEVVDDPLPLPPVHPPLHPIGEPRRAILADSLPILDTVAGEIRGCEKCGLCTTRTNTVPGVGSAASGIVFVGEAPGADEDAQGEPFVGRAGQLLTQMIRAMDEKQLIPGVKLDRSTVYICNVLKCRPPENRNPLPHEIEQCSPYLKRQLEALKPRIICCLGKFAAELLVGVKGSSLGAMRGKTYRYRGAKLIVTYHPAALLRNPNWKKPAWEDLQRLAQEYRTE